MHMKTNRRGGVPWNGPSRASKGARTTVSKRLSCEFHLTNTTKTSSFVNGRFTTTERDSSC